jgi:curli biogenesis system outer membrane secretion channel CsgG
MSYEVPVVEGRTFYGGGAALVRFTTFIRLLLLTILVSSMSVSALAQVVSGASVNAIDNSPTTSHTQTPSGKKVTLKRKVAIARFTNETRSGTSFLTNKGGDRVGKQASDILSAKLAASGQFLLFERIDSEKTSAEQVLAGIEAEGVGVEYLILGSVSEFGRSNESQSGVFSRAKEQKAYAKVNVRLVEVATGRVIHSAEGAGESISKTKTTLGAGSRAGFDQSLTDKAIAAAIAQVTGRLIESMTATPWRSFLLSKQGDGYFIAGGSSQGLQRGIQLVVYKKGLTVKNPQTGSSIELPGSLAARLVVRETYGSDEFNELSLVSILSGDIEGALDQYYVEEG